MILAILMISAALALAAVPVCVIFVRSKRVSKVGKTCQIKIKFFSEKIKAAQKADLESIAESNRRDTLLNR